MKLSIITICRNDAAGLARTLDSTFSGQKGTDDWEQIVVDGASTDGSFAVLDKWKDDPHLGWHVSEPDKGIYNAMNKGALHARGDWLLFLNSGDSLHSGILQKVLPELHDADIVYGNVELDVDGYSYPTERVPAAGDLHPAYFLFAPLHHQASFISKRLHERMGGYDESLRIFSDQKFFLASLSSGSAVFRDIPFVVSTFTIGGMSTGVETSELGKREKESVFRKFFGPAVARRAAFPPEARPWIRGPVAEIAKRDAAFARCLRRSADMKAFFWKLAPARACLKGTTWVSDRFALFAKRKRKLSSNALSPPL